MGDLTSDAALVGMVDTEPLTKGDEEGREDDALDGAVSEYPGGGIVSCESEGYVVEMEEEEEEGVRERWVVEVVVVVVEDWVGVVAETEDDGFMGDIHKDGGRFI